MANFMGPMAPPQAAPQQPPQMDVRTSPSQRAQFKSFMSNIGMGVPPLSLAPPVPQISTPMIPSSPMMGVDIFSAPPQMFYAGGPVRGGGGADAGQMAADTFSRTAGTLDSSRPSVQREREDALAGILSAAPVPEPVYNMPSPLGMALDVVQPSLPAPVQGIMNAANTIRQGITMPGPAGIGQVSIQPTIGGSLLNPDFGFDASYSLNFKDGGAVRHMRYGGSTMGIGSSGQASGFSSVNDRAEREQRDRVEGNDRGEQRGISPELAANIEQMQDAADAVSQANEFVSAQNALNLARDIQRANEFVSANAAAGPDPFDRPTVDRSQQMGGFFDEDYAPGGYLDDSFENLNEPGIFGVAGSEYSVDGPYPSQGFENVTQVADFFDDILRIPMALQKTPSIMGQGLGRSVLSPESFKQAAIDFLDQPGAVYDPETGGLRRPVGRGYETMNRFGNVTYTGPRADDPNQPERGLGAFGFREGVDVLAPLAADEADPCPPGYELKDGTCVPVTPNQIGDVVTPPTTPPATPVPSVVVPSPRPPVGPLRGPATYQGPATFNQSAILTPEFFQNLLKPAARPIGMKNGGEVLDAAADQFLMGLRAA